MTHSFQPNNLALLPPQWAFSGSESKQSQWFQGREPLSSPEHATQLLFPTLPTDTASPPEGRKCYVPGLVVLFRALLH